MTRLSTESQRRIANAQATVDALMALSELAGLLDPDGERAAWWLAGELERLLLRFESRGCRSLGPTLSSRLDAYCRSGLPRSRRKLYELLD